MKPKIFLTLIFAAISFNCFSQDLIFDWKHTIHNGQRSNEGRSICTDTAGYVYVGGRLEDTVYFIDTILNCVEDNAFLAKLSPDGELVWVKWYRYCSLITAMCFDHENNLCVTGNYYLYIDLGDTILYTNHADTGYCSNQFIAKYDTDGNLLWAKSNTGVYISGYSNPVHNITVDNENNILITGRCIEELQYFDTSIVITTLDSALVTYPYPYWYYYYASIGFLAKYSSDGNFLWVKELGGSSCEPASVKTDNSDNIFVTGQFNNTAYFDTIMIEPYGYDIFLVKYSSDGDLQWVETAGGSAGDKGFDISVDNDNNVYLTGSIQGDNIQFGGNIIFSHAWTDAYYAKYDSTGDFKWVKPIGTSHNITNITSNFGASLFIRDNYLYLLGSFMDSLNFNGIILEDYFGKSMFIVKMDLDGNVLKAGQYAKTGSGWIWTQELTLDNNNDIYFIANYQENSSNNDYTIIIGKTSADIPININEIPSLKDNISVFPNPSNGIFTIKTNNSELTDILIYDLTGKELYNKNINVVKSKINISFLHEGCYILQLRDKNNIVNKKIIIEK